MPAWRPSDGFTYLGKGANRIEPIFRKDDGEVVLSRNWPDEILNELTW